MTAPQYEFTKCQVQVCDDPDRRPFSYSLYDMIYIEVGKIKHLLKTNINKKYFIHFCRAYMFSDDINNISNGYNNIIAKNYENYCREKNIKMMENNDNLYDLMVIAAAALKYFNTSDNNYYRILLSISSVDGKHSVKLLHLLNDNVKIQLDADIKKQGDNYFAWLVAKKLISTNDYPVTTVKIDEKQVAKYLELAELKEKEKQIMEEIKSKTK